MNCRPRWPRRRPFGPDGNSLSSTPGNQSVTLCFVLGSLYLLVTFDNFREGGHALPMFYWNCRNTSRLDPSDLPLQTRHN